MKVHPPLIRAIAHTLLYSWAYPAFDHLIEHGIDAHAACSWSAINRSKCADKGREIVDRHVAAFAAVNIAARGPDADAFCRLLLDCDAVTLAWWCEHRFGPALAALDVQVAP